MPDARRPTQKPTPHAPGPKPVDAWPDLPLAPWASTQQTLHLWTQIVGKVRLALAPVANHWWATTFYLTPRGLTTGVLYHPNGPLELAFDFVDHRLTIDLPHAREAMELRPRSVADFHDELMSTLRRLERGVVIGGTPNELPDPIPYAEDETHGSYDAGAVERFLRAMQTSDRLLRVFAARWLGKQSPSHFFWGSFDMALTRFSGRGAPEHPGGFPHLPDWVTREAYSHELASFGWWPGNGPFGRAAFYAYAYPTPDGFRDATDLPDGAFWLDELGEYVFPWDDARAADDPDAAVLRFLQATYEAAASAGGWPRDALEGDAGRPDRLERLVRRSDRPV